jgi:NitT/TauT family transport system permease protein
MFLVPPLSAVLVAGYAMVQTGTWQAAAMITLHSFAVGMALAIVVGISLGVLMGRFKAVDELFSIWVNIFVSAPLSALVPVLMILFGMGETTVIVTVFLFAAFSMCRSRLLRWGAPMVPLPSLFTGKSFSLPHCRRSSQGSDSA